MLSPQIEELLKVMEVLETAVKSAPKSNENYLKKLASLSRYVTPCPDILDDVFYPINNSRNSDVSDVRLHKEDLVGRSQSFDRANESARHHPECIDSSESSDESAWESVPTPPSNSGRQWKNLLQYEASLMANMKAMESANISPQKSTQNNPSVPSSSSSQNLPSKADIYTNEDIVKVLNSIAESLKKLEGHKCENATAMFGQYVSHRLSELSEENRSLAEIEINQVLVKYVIKDFQGSSSSVDQKLEQSGESGNSSNKNKRK